MKSAIVEALTEQRDLVEDVVEEALEEVALSHAIQQGLSSESIPCHEVFAILEGK